MRTPVVCTVFAALALLSCHRSVGFVSGDDYGEGAKSALADVPCNDVPQRGTPVDLTGSHARAPTPTGGTILDGTYVLTSSTLYTSERSHGAKIVEMGRITMRIRGSTSEVVRATSAGAERRTTVNREVSGTTATMKTMCASPRTAHESPSTAAYTATDSSLQFVMPGPAGTVVSTYQRL